MKKQKTFEEIRYALEYLEHLRHCFQIKKVKITTIYNKKWCWNDYRLEVSYK